MDYQAGASSTINRFLRITKDTALTIVCVGVVFVFSGLHVFAQYIEPDPSFYAENPLSVSVAISATAPSPTITTQLYPDAVPMPGPINMVDTIDSAIFKGLAYPDATIYLLKNGDVMGQTKAGKDGYFDIRLRSLPQGTFTFGLKAEDSFKNVSKIITVTVFISGGVATTVGGIFMPPTITSDKTEVKKGEIITFSGLTAPYAEIRLSLGKGSDEVIKKIHVTASGIWSYVLDSSEFSFGDYEAKARALLSDSLSPYSEVLFFKVGEVTKLRVKNIGLSGFRKKCDLNNDNRVNLLDFSIMAFWYKRLGFPPKVDLNTDTKINLTDLSILAYCWTG
jgi:hypothetical protein